MRIPLLIVCALAAFSVAGQENQAAAGPQATTPPAPAATEPSLIDATCAELQTLDVLGFQRLPPARPGDWLHHYKEEPQTIERYRMRAKIRPSPERRTVVLQPLGEFDAEAQQILEIMRDYSEIFFQLPARVEKPIAWDATITDLTRQVPPSRRVRNYEKQYNGEVVMSKILKKNIPQDAAVYLGVTMDDLCTSDTNFVFGVASFKDRVGVYSLARYFPDFWGHMFGISHCVFYKCSMNGSNTLEETDRAPVHFCPLCHRKLLWNIGFDPQKRFDHLEAFYTKHNLKDEAVWMKKRSENWKKLDQTEALKKVQPDE
jgi:archaemetzincin